MCCRYFKYANLNPRIAAYLGKQDPKNILKRAKSQGAKADGKENGTTAPSGREYGNDLSREARSLLPDIEQAFGGMSMINDPSFDQSRFLFPGENEDPQRYQFEETTFAAPNILRELADILSRFVVAFKNYSQRTTLYDPDTGEPLLGDSISPSVLIPGGVKELLCQSWSDLTAEVVYAPRMWQSSTTRNSMRYPTSLVVRSDVSPGVTNDPLKTASEVVEKKSIGGGLKSIVDLLQEVQSKSRSKRDGEALEAKIALDYKKKGKDSTQLSTLTPGKFLQVRFRQRFLFFLLYGMCSSKELHN